MNNSQSLQESSGALSPDAECQETATEFDASVAAILVENHRRFLDFLSRRVPHVTDAEEILQEAYVRSLARGDSIRTPEATTAWFYRLLRNALVDYYRKRGAERRALDAASYELAGAERQGMTPPVDEELHQVVCSCVNSLITTLKDSYAEAIRQVDLGGNTLQDYALHAGISENNAAVRLHRARGALRSRLVKCCGTCATHGCVDCHCGAPAACP